jgi:hypothetical protein
MWILLFFSLLNAHALEVIKHVKHRKIQLRIVRAEPDSFETYSLMNHNGREMILICANNYFWDHNPKAMIEYRNYYNEIAGYFTIEDNKVCKDIGKTLETSSMGIDKEHPFLIDLDTKSLKVSKIVYPNVDPFIDEGDMKDLMLKPIVPVKGNLPSLLPQVQHN